MKLVIGDPVPNTKTPNTFEVIITTMEGDADGYDDILVGPFQKDQDEHLMEHLFSTLKEMKDAYPHGRGGHDEYTHIDGFLLWFSGDDLTEKYMNEYYPEYSGSLEDFVAKAKEINALYERSNNYAYWEHESNSGIANSYTSYKVLYYDENKVAHNVTVEN